MATRAAVALTPPAKPADRLARHHPRRARTRAPGSAALRAAQRSQRIGLLRYMRSGKVGTVFTAPLVYSLFLPFVILDVWVTSYQAACFRAWGLSRVRRRDYFAIDRHRLVYLNAVERINCMFCSYANGLLAYVREIAARTEEHWCPIRHARRIRGVHGRYESFAPYGDARAYRVASRHSVVRQGNKG